MAELVKNNLWAFVTIFAALCVMLIYYIIAAIEDMSKKRLYNGVQRHLAKIDKITEFLLQYEFFERIINAIADQIGFTNVKSQFENQKQAVVTIFFTLFAFILLYFYTIRYFAHIWYLYIIYFFVSIIVLLIIFRTIAEQRERKIVKQLPECAYLTNRRYGSLKKVIESIKSSLDDYPNEFRNEMIRIVEFSGDVSQAIEYASRRIRNPWFKILLTIIKEAYIRGDKEGAFEKQLSEYTDSVNAELAIVTSNESGLFLQKVTFLGVPFLIPLIQNFNKYALKYVNSGFYDSSENYSMILIIIMGSILGFIVTSILEKI
ncbi:MAG: hypothetical protein AB7G87_04920 [Clostridia bacterium]